MENTNTKILYTVKEVAEILHTNPAYVYILLLMPGFCPHCGWGRTRYGTRR